MLYSRIGGDWSDVAFYGIGALLLALSGLSLMVWVEMAPDGAFRGRPRD